MTSFASRRLILGLTVACLSSCTSAESAPPVGFSTAWLTPTGVIPDTLERLRVVRVVTPGSETELFERSIGGLTDEDENGRRELIVEGLVTGQTVDLELQGFDADGIAFVGRSGPVFLTQGERRFVNVAMYPVGPVEVDRETPPPSRMMHQATTLLDGRVLISGGFTSVGPTTCPATFPAEANCVRGEATGDAWLFDPPSARFFPVQGDMLEARGGHTATLLEDGRVVVAGGAPSAIIGTVVRGDSGATQEIFFQPEGALATFELFEPQANAELEDLERNGDPGAGGFLGGVAEAGPGALNSPRFLHAAARAPHDGNQVLLIGGFGGASSFEVFDARKPGGPGVYAATNNTLGTPRSLPGATSVGGTTAPTVWIFGGADAASNDDLAEVWEPSDADPNGTLLPATMGRFRFPDNDATARPEFALLRPTVVPVEDSILATGWYGPRCEMNNFGSEPIFSGPSICNQNRGTRSFTVDPSTGVATETQPSSGVLHAFSEAVPLTGNTTRIVVLGGFENGAFRANPATLVYQSVSGGSARSAAGPRLARGRLFGASARIFDSGVLIFGGATLTSNDSGLSMQLIDDVEAIMLPPPGRDRVVPGGPTDE
ncbi:MAG: hypothetical protein AAGE52_02960 [Myxococcota bacterium]